MVNKNVSLREAGLFNGRMISPSKSQYRSENPDNFVCFNARIFVLSEGLIWSGDLDITKDYDMLKKAESAIGETLYVLRESPEFNFDENLTKNILSNTIWDTTKPKPINE